ncbi:hypothetical protein J4212_00365 [Candidatus Woesearchaeota archaeon]|nr:hypothetical protein [Candidatus Woesearchaeota archaeon]
MGFKFPALAAIMLLAVSCSPENEGSEAGAFKSEEYGFTFSYPADWEQITKDLPNNWAIRKSDNLVIFTVNPTNGKPLNELGVEQALSDFSGSNEGTSEDEAAKSVGVRKFGQEEWYTYAIKFAGEGIDSFVSGTVCGDSHIVVVLVTSPEAEPANLAMYTSMLNSFKCG